MLNSLKSLRSLKRPLIKDGPPNLDPDLSNQSSIIIEQTSPSFSEQHSSKLSDDSTWAHPWFLNDDEAEMMAEMNLRNRTDSTSSWALALRPPSPVIKETGRKPPKRLNPKITIISKIQAHSSKSHPKISDYAHPRVDTVSTTQDYPANTIIDSLTQVQITNLPSDVPRTDDPSTKLEVNLTIPAPPLALHKEWSKSSLDITQHLLVENSKGSISKFDLTSLPHSLTLEKSQLERSNLGSLSKTSPFFSLTPSLSKAITTYNTTPSSQISEIKKFEPSLITPPNEPNFHLCS